VRQAAWLRAADANPLRESFGSMAASSIAVNWDGRDEESLLWIASYPRSGNTFTRILLANYFVAGQDTYDLNRLHTFIPPDTSGVLWDEFAKQHPVAAIPEGMWKSRQRFFGHYRTKKIAPLAAFKTHTANIEAFGSKAFDFRKNDRIIYVVRHPLDVALSYSDFNGQDLEFAIQNMSESGTCLTHKEIGVFEVRGSWTEHVASWLTMPACPLLLVRYEDLRSNTAQVLESMLAFLGTPVISQRVEQAVEASRFDKVRATEAAHNFAEAPETLKSGTFFRKGTSLQWLRELSPEQAYRLADACEPIMSKLGYAHPRDVYFDGRNALQPINLRA
jgi:hypothetical protein